MKNLFLIIILILGLSCSKKSGMTSSKIKIFSGNFAALLSAQANNGLVLYGKSDNGKSFLKKINSDAIDLDLPNGVWSFYAIAWGFASPSSETGFKGKTICGKNLGVPLLGTSVTLNMNLSNANCDGAFHPDVDVVAGEKKFPTFSLNNCKSLASVVDSNSAVNCSSSVGNKGVATYIKVEIPEYSKLGAPGDTVMGPAISSRCIEMDGSSSASSATAADAANMSAMSFPARINGMALGLKVYYSSTPCDESTFPDLFSLQEGDPSPRMKKFIAHTAGTQAIERLFVETSPSDICVGPRLSNLSFASGRGLPFLPYGICTKEQLNLIQADFTHQYSNHFELLSDLNFSFNEFNPIGDTANDPTQAFIGSFDGNGKRIENVFINCKNYFTSAAPKSGMGFFRYTNGATIKNLTLNKVAVRCGDESSNTDYVDNVGMLVGTAYDTSFSNIKSFGFAGGRDNVGGLVGLFDGAGAGEFIDVHIQGAVEGRRYLGGVIGKGMNFASAPNKLVVSKSSFKGEIHGKLKSNLAPSTFDASGGTEPTVGNLGDYVQIGVAGNLPLASAVAINDFIYYDPNVSGSDHWRKFKGGYEVPYDTFAGGLAGHLSSINNAKISEVKIDLDKLEGSRLMGGMIGKSEKISLENNYVIGLIKSYHDLDGTSAGSGFIKTAGLVGYGSEGNFTKNIIAVIKSLNAAVADTTQQGVLGTVGTSPTCSDNLFLGTASTGGCNTNFKLITELAASTEYANFSINTAASIWVLPTSDNNFEIPRLSWEASKENEVPYLKRLCSGLHATQAGDGTLTAPKSICNLTQFLAMQPNIYYELRKNLVSPNGTSIPGFNVGNYHLNGNHFSLINFSVDGQTTLDSALFKELSVGSEIKNLKIVSSKISSSNKSLVSSEQYNIALLAAKNAGTIKDIEVVDSKVDVVRLSAGATSISNIGGLVAINNSTGVIKNIESDITVHVGADTSYVQLKMGGAVAQNLGEISIYRQNGLVERVDGERVDLQSTSCATLGDVVYSTGTYNGRYKCTSYVWGVSSAPSPYTMISTDQFGGFVAYNTGTISEVEFGGHVSILDLATNAAGSISPFIAEMNGGHLNDIFFRGSFDNSHYPISNFFSSFTGSINRMIIQFESTFAGATFSTIDNIIPTSVPSSSEVICIGTYLGCHPDVKYTHSATGLTFYDSALNPITGFSNLPNWNVGTSFIPDQTKTWQLEPGKSLNLMRTGGDFDKLGAGF